LSEPRRKWVGKGLGKDQRLRVPTRHVEARETGLGTQILASFRAVSAEATDRVEPRSSDGVPFAKSAGPAPRCLHVPYCLVTGDERKSGRRDLAPRQAEVVPVDPAGI